MYISGTCKMEKDISIESRAGIKSKRGRKRIENNQNESCRLCKESAFDVWASSET